jgi:diaminohydroxyphosphoribosylaminopyrimidine deaminase / 5-amino-6-(5-phosphoribosylamino)uracil reductase
LPNKNPAPESEIDISFMQRALDLAEKGRGFVSPNPMVGAVVVKDGKVVGEGYHQKFGEAHAEVNAIDAAGDDAAGATLYVTLEPCCHQGKTGPCTDKIYETGIATVVAGMRDPNPIVNGKGITDLRSRGITVIEGVLKEKCYELNRGYIKYIITKIPFITLKIAQTLDGRIATSTGHSKWITSEEAREMGHHLRATHDAIMAGIQTVLTDDPHLVVYMVKGISPKRIVLDSRLRVPLDANIFSGSSPQQTIIVTTDQASKEKISRIEEKGSMVLVLPADERGWVSLPTLWAQLGELGITSVLVEGGSTVITECLKNSSADQIVIFLAPKILGSGIDAIGDLNIRNINSAIPLYNIQVQEVGCDLMVTGWFSPHVDTV